MVNNMLQFFKMQLFQASLPGDLRKAMAQHIQTTITLDDIYQVATDTQHAAIETTQEAAPPGPLQHPASPPNSTASGSPATSSPRSSPTPSTSGTRPKQTPPQKVQQSQPDPSGASTSATTPQPPAAKAHNLMQRSKVDYKDLNTGASQFGRAEFQIRCSRAGASARKSVAKVRKMSLAELFPPISQNSSSSSTASSK
jgi:hypothetical protein